ncbi:MAG: acyltransferase [Treponema sp.]|nr:acyltransferase [Treponema sp.]
MHYKNSSRYRLLLLFSLGIKVLRGFIKSFFHFKGCRIVAVGKNVSFLGKRSNLTIGNRVKIEDRSSIQSVSENGIQFSDNVTICQNAIIRPSGFYGGLLGKGLKMGHHSSIGAFSYIGCAGQINIGNYVMIGPRCTMIAEQHNFSDANEIMQKQGVTQKGINIEDNVWIGANVTILDGVTIKSGCVIGAGAVVTKSTEPNGIYAGVPARKIKERI